MNTFNAPGTPLTVNQATLVGTRALVEQGALALGGQASCRFNTTVFWF